MDALQRITTEYVFDQDRIRIAGEIERAVTVTLWLTRRLVGGVIPHLLDWLQSNVAAALHISRSKSDGQGAEEKNTSGALAHYEETIQGFAQAAALSSQSPQNPVRPGADDKNFIVQAVDIISSRDAIKLVFKASATDDETPPVFITMNEQTLRQWLHILHDQTGIADWQLSIWPDWIAEKSDKPTAQTNITLH